MKRKVLALLCATVMIFSTVISASAADSGYISTSIPKSFPVVKQDSSYTVVNFWHAMTGRYAVLVDNIVNWYNATSGKKDKIYVKSIFQGAYDAMTTKIQAALQANNVKNLPDVIQLNSAGAFSVKESKYIIYMEDLISTDATFKSIKEKLNKNALWACSYKGKLMGMPFSNSMISLHYNATAFKAAGLDPDDPPKTLAELATYSQKLVIKGTGKKPKRYGLSTQVANYQLSTWIPRQKKGTAYQFNMEDGRQGVPTSYSCATDGTLKATLTEWKKVLDTGTVEYTNSAPRANFETGLNAMCTQSMVQFDTIDQTFATYKDKSKVFDHRMARIPCVNADDSTSEAIGGSAIYMFNKSDTVKKAAAWKFVKFVASTDVSAYWYVQSGYYPLNNDALKTKYVADCWKTNPNKKVMVTIRNDSVKDYKFQEPWIPSLYQYDTAVINEATLLAQGKHTVDQAVASIAKKSAALLTTYAKANG